MRLLRNRRSPPNTNSPAITAIDAMAPFGTAVGIDDSGRPVDRINRKVVESLTASLRGGWSTLIPEVPARVRDDFDAGDVCRRCVTHRHALRHDDHLRFLFLGIRLRLVHVEGAGHADAHDQ